MRLIAGLLLTLLTSSAYAQIDIPAVASPYEPIIARTGEAGIPEGVEVKTTWTLDEGLFPVFAEDGSVYLWGKPGKYNLSATIVWMKFREIEVEGETFKVMELWDVVQQRGTFEIATGAEPEPDPSDPDLPVDVPDDEFGNIGKKVAAWAESLKVNKAKEAASVYQEASDRLLGKKQPIILTIDKAVEYIKEENGKLGLNDEWPELAGKINEVWKSQVTGRESAGKFFACVAAGLKGT